MEEQKDLDKGIFIFITLMSFLAAFANAMATNKHIIKDWREVLIQVVIGAISGMIFGLLACWLIGENSYAVGSISGIGAILGVNGLRSVALLVMRYIELKLKK